MGIVERQVYRALLRRARAFDNEPWKKCFLHGEPRAYYDRSMSQWVSTNTADATLARSVFRDGLHRFTQHGTFYRPTVSLERIIRGQFRRNWDTAVTDDARLDAAFMALSLLETGAAASGHYEKTAAEPQGPRTRPAHVSLAQEKFVEAPLATGSVLVAHPMLLQEGLTRSCLVLVRYHEDQGAVALVVNCRLGLRVGDLFGDAPREDGEGLEDFIAPFAA